ncbi:hypothetical protein CMO92_03545 [Candidatus Woesearchaeota archaeon]|nr:hypothetical protein [Candidatus Woesearchaeota archaeon]|tara:strand:- start:1294 stop:1704 length:411 start_codon:yes stop_codon:yes gene_type:complete
MEKNDLLLVSIVGIVAVVAVVMLFWGSGATVVDSGGEAQNIAGQAFKGSLKDKPISIFMQGDNKWVFNPEEMPNTPEMLGGNWGPCDADLKGVCVGQCCGEGHNLVECQNNGQGGTICTCGYARCAGNLVEKDPGQ